MLRQQGYRVRSGGAATFGERVSEQLKAMDKALAEQATTHEVAKRSCTAVGVGPATASSFVATIDRLGRFDNAKQAHACLGLVPAELTSGEEQRRSYITEISNRRMRALWVEASWQLLHSGRSDTETLRAWTNRIAPRRGKRIAAVALARKLAGILFAMWRDGIDFGKKSLGIPCGVT